MEFSSQEALPEAEALPVGLEAEAEAEAMKM